MSRLRMRDTLISMDLQPLASDQVWPAIDRSGQLRRFEPGSLLWRASADAASLYIVLDGRVRIVRAFRGRQHLVHVAGPGDTIGEVPVLDGAGYPATAIAAEAVACLAVPGPVVLELIERDGRVGRFFLERLGRRVRGLVERLAQQTLGDVRSRLAASLVGLSVEQGSATIDLPRPQAEWAEDLGTVRETLAREIGRLVKEGVIERAGRGRVRVLDEFMLEVVSLHPQDRFAD